LVFVANELEANNLTTLIKAHATLKEYPLPSNREIASYIREKLPNITSLAVSRLMETIPCYLEKRQTLEYIPGSFEELSRAISQLSIYKEDKKIEAEDISHIQSSGEIQIEIYTALNSFYANRPFEACSLLEQIFEKFGVRETPNILIGSLRKAVYIQLLLASGKTVNDLTALFGGNPYAFQAAQKQTSALPKMIGLLSKTVDYQIKFRKGELPGQDEENMLLFIQKTIFSLSM